MKKEKLGQLNTKKINFMLDNGIIEELTLENVGNYLTTVYLSKYLVTPIIKKRDINFDTKKTARKKRKNLIEVFNRMRQKYNYAYFVNFPLNTLYCINKTKSEYHFRNDIDGEYPRIVFTNYSELNEYFKIELNPEYYDSDILESCLNDMKKARVSFEHIDLLYDYIKVYKYTREIIDAPKRILSELELRYIFDRTLEKKFHINGNSFNPYKQGGEREDAMDYLMDDSIEFETILNHFEISKKSFYNITQKIKASDGLFVKELTHLKKYLTLAYVYDTRLYPYFLDKDGLSKEKYTKRLKEFIADKYVFENLSKLYKLLTLPYKLYEVLDFHSKEYKKLFHYYKTQGFSKWQTQEIMRRYREITEQQQIEPPVELLDMVELFLVNYKYVPPNLMGKNIEKEHGDFLKRLENTTK